MRIVSLLPGATEIVCALGLEPVGVSHECDYPPAVKDRPQVTRSHVTAQTTQAVDDQMETALSEHGAVFEVDVDRLSSLDPDLVVTQRTCEVCAVDASVVREAIDDSTADPAVLEIDPHTLEDVIATVGRIGTAAGVPDRAEALEADLRNRIQRVPDQLPASVERPHVVVLDWLSPLMVAGHWVPEVVRAAGGRYDLVDTGNPSRVREWQEIREADPDLLVAAPCGLDVAATMADAHFLADRPGWDKLTAVEEGRVYAMDGNAHLNRPGPRMVDAVEYLAGLLFPSRFPAPPITVARPVFETARTPERSP